MNTPKVISLLRVSTDGQDVSRQRTDVRRVIDAFKLDCLRTEEVVDVSGRHVMADPQFQRVFRDLERSDVGGVVVSALDRLFRPTITATSPSWTCSGAPERKSGPLKRACSTWRPTRVS
jgi:DNA invertase Pin-like site-specific DNA recombinase